MSQLEQQARREWQRGAVWHGAGTCDQCGRSRGEDGRFLQLARKRGARKRLCLDCYDQGRRR